MFKTTKKNPKIDDEFGGPRICLLRTGGKRNTFHPVITHCFFFFLCVEFNKNRNIIENALQICLKCQVYNECVMPTMTNGCQIAKQINCLRIKLQLHKDH